MTTVPEAESNVKWWTMGIDVPIDPDEDGKVTIQMARINQIQGLDKHPELKKLALISCLIDKISGLEHVPQLTQLDLYQNEISTMENISHLKELEVLDLSFNAIRQINDIESLTKLRILQLANNKITTIEGIDKLVNLEQLELGGNRIREVTNISNLACLTELWLGRNKITSMSMPPLPKLDKLSLQCNRLSTWDTSLFENCSNLTELYLSENQLPAPPIEIEKLSKLSILDLAYNVVEDLSSMSRLQNITEIWLNDNKIENLSELEKLQDMKSLKTIYLERNPFQQKLGPGYRSAVLQILPQLIQLDALLVEST